MRHPFSSALLFAAWSLAAPAGAGPLDLPGLEQREASNRYFDGQSLPDGGGETPVYAGEPAPRPALVKPVPPGVPRTKIDLPASFVAAKDKPFYDDPKRQQDLIDRIKSGDNYTSPYFLGDKLGPGVEDAFHPVLGVAEHFADRVYAITTGGFSFILPESLSHDFSRAPSSNTVSDFDLIFHEKERIFLTDLNNTRPYVTDGEFGGMPNHQAYRDWEKWAVNKQLDVLANSGGEWAIRRYGLQAMGRKFGKDIQNGDNWTVGTVAVAVVGGGIMGWFFGLQQPISYGPMRMHVDLHSADAVVRAVQNSGDVGRVAGVEVGPKDDHYPSLYFNEEVKSGKWRTGIYGLRLSRRFKTRPWD